MKRIVTAAFLLFVMNLNAQMVDCASGRFDTEVFSSIDTMLNIQYGSNIDVNGTAIDLSLDVYMPSNDTMVKRPLIVWVHGGSFLAGTKNDIDVVQLCQRFAKRGYVCASIDYRLGMGFPIDSISAAKAVYRAVQDMKAAVRFFRKDAATTNTYKIDPDIIFGGGSSAGGFTALHLAYLNDYAELPTAIDTVALGGLEGNTGNAGYRSDIKAVVNLCGALARSSWIKPGDVPFVSMHGNVDATVPYATAIIRLIGVFPIMQVDGSYSISRYADSIGVYNQMYTFFGADHVPYATNAAYMDTTVRFVSNFLFTQLGCSPSDPNPLPNTFITEVAENSSPDFIVYPNPAKEIITIQSEERIKSISLFDLSGRKLISTQGNRIELSDFERGIYIIQVTMLDGKVGLKKIVLD